MANDSRGDLRVNLAESKQSINDSVAGADAARAQGLAGLQQVRAVKDRSLASERERLVVKHNADHPLVATLDQSIAVNGQLQRDLKIEVERASAPAPKADPYAWQVHGYVFRDRDRTGVANLTVSLCDEKGTWIESAGHSCTDKTGYFAPLSIKPDKPSPRGTASDRIEAMCPVFIHVTDPRKTLFFRDTQPTVPSVGTVMYREIILGETPPCEPPETLPRKDGPGKGGPGKEARTKKAPTRKAPAKEAPAKGDPS